MGQFFKLFDVHLLAKILCYDGCTLWHNVLDYRRGESDRAYPYKKLLCHDLEFWVSALKLITSSTLVLEQPLGAYLITPPGHDG